VRPLAAGAAAKARSRALALDAMVVSVIVVNPPVRSGATMAAGEAEIGTPAPAPRWHFAQACDFLDRGALRRLAYDLLASLMARHRRSGVAGISTWRTP